MSTIAVFGATGRTGFPFVQKALEEGYVIRALVRNPRRLAIDHSNLQIIKGDVLDPEKVCQIIEDVEGVVSTIGQDIHSPPDLQTRATQLIINSMHLHGVQRLITVTGGGVRDIANDKPGFMDRLLVFTMRHLAGKKARNTLFDGINHAEIVRKSNLDWTIVRSPILTNDPETGIYRVGSVGTVSGLKLTRADLADFLLKEFEKGTYIHKMPFITNG